MSTPAGRSSRWSESIVLAVGSRMSMSRLWIRIEAGRAEAHYWRDLWRYRDLFYFLAWRDLLVRYKQTVFGVLWRMSIRRL